LGIVLLNRAQGLADPEARRQEFEKAEKTFLAIRSAAENRPDFRLNLGQVYFWLGKQAEGRKIFEEHLIACKGHPEALVQLAGVFRQVGALSDARKMAEEAYDKENDAKKRAEIAGSRSVMGIDIEDRLLWLKRSDPNNPAVQADMNYLQGAQRLQVGDDAGAEPLLRQAIALYDKLPENSATLNNSALVYQALFAATGKREALNLAIARLEKALSLQPENTILLRNTAHELLDEGLGEIALAQIDLKA